MPGHENDAQAAGRGHRERCRHQRLAVDRRFGARLGAGRQIRELGAALLVGRRGSRRAARPSRAPACPATLLPIASRTTRTVTVPVGSSGAGMARPWISDGSGMLIWRGRQRKAQGPSHKAQGPDAQAQARSAFHDAASSLVPQFLQNRASASLLVPQLDRLRRCGASLVGLADRGLRRARGSRASVRRALRSPSRSARDTVLPASSCRISRAARARSRALISAKSFSDTFPIARSNSSSLIERSTSVFSRSSAARVRPPSTCGPDRLVAAGERRRASATPRRRRRRPRRWSG